MARMVHVCMCVIAGDKTCECSTTTYSSMTSSTTCPSISLAINTVDVSNRLQDMIIVNTDSLYFCWTYSSTATSLLGRELLFSLGSRTSSPSSSIGLLCDDDRKVIVDSRQ